MKVELIGRKYLVGVDPSFYSCGVCVYAPAEKTMQLFTGDFFEAVGFINKTVKLSEVVAVVENPAINSAVFGAFYPLKGEILQLIAYERWKANPKTASLSNLPRQKSMADVEKMFGMASKQAQNVGESKASAKLIISMFKKRNVPVIEVAPSQRDRADKPAKSGILGVKMLTMPTKTNAHQFREITGYIGQSSEHSRDAATLVHGRTITWAETMLLREVEKAAAEIRSNAGKVTVKKGKFVLV